MTTNIEQIIRKAYKAFNDRRIDDVLELMDPDVHWPNGWEGGYVNGHEEVRNYWTRQWKEIDPKVSPLLLNKLSDDKVEVKVQQTVKDLEGKIVFDGIVKHIYTFKQGLIESMQIEET